MEYFPEIAGRIVSNNVSAPMEQQSAPMTRPSMPDSGPEDRDLDELILALEAADLCREWLMDIRDRMLDRARERKPDEPA